MWRSSSSRNQPTSPRLCAVSVGGREKGKTKEMDATSLESFPVSPPIVEQHHQPPAQPLPSSSCCPILLSSLSSPLSSPSSILPTKSSAPSTSTADREDPANVRVEKARIIQNLLQLDFFSTRSCPQYLSTYRVSFPGLRPAPPIPPTRATFKSDVEDFRTRKREEPKSSQPCAFAFLEEHNLLAVGLTTGEVFCSFHVWVNHLHICIKGERVPGRAAC